MKNKFNLNLCKSFLIASCILLIISSIVFRNFLSPAFWKINSSINVINTINNSLSSALKETVIVPEIATDNLKDCILKLKAEKDKLKTIQPSNKYKNSYNNLIIGLENNIKLYEQTLAILNSPSSQDLPKAFNDMMNYKNNCEKYYKLCSSDGLKIKLTSNATIFLKNSSNYINALIKLKRDSDIKNSQKNDFLISMDKCIERFSKINEDLSPIYERLQRENKGFQVLIDDINKKMADFSDLKTSLYSIAIPSDAIDYYSEFQEILDQYDKYINNIFIEIKSNEKPDIIIETASYINVINQSFEAFKNKYSTYKDK